MNDMTHDKSTTKDLDISVADTLSAAETSLTTTSDSVSVNVCISDPNSTLIDNNSVQTDAIDVVLVNKEHINKPASRKSKSNKKEKCPCSVSDTLSWKLKCTDCNQTWHSACCNLLGIASITELVEWKCPWCFVPLFNKPNTPRNSTSPNHELQSSVNCLLTKFDDFNKTDINALQSQINQLQNTLSNFLSSPMTPSFDNINKIHDEILNSIKFELQNIISNQETVLKESLGTSKADHNASKNTSLNSNEPVISFTGSHYDHHSNSFLEEECIDNLKTFVTENDTKFTKVGTREVLYFGEFGYKYGDTAHKPAPIPDSVQKVIDKIHSKFPNSTKVNSCLVTKYINGSIGCPSHWDDEPFISPTSDIFTLSLGAERVMKFVNCNNHAETLDESLILKENDIISFSRLSQNFFHHSIEPDSDVSTVRYSLTFRSLAPYNINYTSIIGDSNTQNLAFGSGMGKLGQWLPGIRHKASQIKDIPDPFVIGPCRNVVLNVGINDIQQNVPKSTECLVNELESKMKPIMTVYPKTKIFISLLLPTKMLIN